MISDEAIIELFFQRSEQAITQLDTRYGKYCRRLADGILNNPQDTEECINDSWLGVWNAIPPARPEPLLTFVCRIVRNTSIKRYHSQKAAKRNSSYTLSMEELEPCLVSSGSVENEVETKALTGIIEGFLDSLPAENRIIFMRRYWFADTYARIAQLTGLTEKNISVRLTRIRRQLRQYLLEREVI